MESQFIISYDQQSDGYIFANVTDGINYLRYMYSPMNGWQTVIGDVDNRKFKGCKTLKYLWDSKGRGRVSEQTYNKLSELHDYFWANKK